MGCVFSVFQNTVLARKEGSMFGSKTRSKEVLVQTTSTSIINNATKENLTRNNSGIYEIASLEEAVKHRNKDLLQELISHGVVFQVLRILDKSYVNPVEKACILGYTDIVKLFLDNGCSPNLPTSCGRLIHSVLEAMKTSSIPLAEGQQLVHFLCQSGCDVNIKSKHGATTLLQAAEFGDAEVLETILKYCQEAQITKQCGGSQFSPLHMSCMRGDLDCVQVLLKHSASKHINLRDANRNTALILALKSMLHNLNYLNSARRNIENGITNPQDKDLVRSNLLKLQHNSIGIVEALLLAGADPNCCCYTGRMRHSDHYDFLFVQSTLYFALQLCVLDDTRGFQDSAPSDEFSHTLKLLSLENLEEVEKWTSSTENSDTFKKQTVDSPYAGVVRLIVLSGFNLNLVSEDEILMSVKPQSYVSLLDEIYEFWNKFKMQRPAKLMHMSKQVIRIHLSHLQRLHRIEELPLPFRVKEYLKLNYL